MPRWLVYASAGVLLAAGVASLLAASTEWGTRTSMIDPLPAEAAEQARFALEMAAIGGINLAASIALLFLRWRAVWWSIVGLQAALFAAALAEAAQNDPLGWIAFSTLPVATLSLLVGLRFVKTKPKPSTVPAAS